MNSIKTEYKDKVEYYNEKGELHRTDGPAVLWNDGSKDWIINGQYHREDGPAMEYSNGSKYWYINGKLHREDGPAIQYYNGHKKWWMNGMEYSEQEWEQQVAKIKLKRILDL
jgi:hypothetical protein